MNGIARMGSLLLVVMLLSGCLASAKERAANESASTQTEQDAQEKLTLQLVSWYHGPGGERHDLNHRIMRFQEAHPNIKITIQWSDYYGDPSPWVQQAAVYNKKTRADDMPDIIELVPNQMRFWYQYGIIEPLNLNETALRPYVITSSDGYVLGLTTKINPLIAYYNKNVFQSLGLDSPSSDWDMDKLTDTIIKLQAARQNVYFPISPYTLEWITSMYGGRIVAPDGMTFSGYINSDQAVQAAEWIAAIGTRIEHYTPRPLDKFIFYTPVPYDLLENKIGLAFEFAYGYNNGAANSYAEITQRDDNIGIAPLPSGTSGVNPAQMSGLSITSQSKNKRLAMELIRYLTTDNEEASSVIAMNTLHENMKKPTDPVNAEDASIVLDETKRAIPAALQMVESHNSLADFLYGKPAALIEILNGGLAHVALKRYAEQLDTDFQTFRTDSDAYDSCIRPWNRYSDTCAN